MNRVWITINKIRTVLIGTIGITFEVICSGITAVSVTVGVWLKDRTGSLTNLPKLTLLAEIIEGKMCGSEVI